MGHIANAISGRELPHSTREKILATLDELMSTVGQASPVPVAMSDPGHLEDPLCARRRRSEFFKKGLFADPAWDMLLELYAASLAGRRVTVTALCTAADVAPTTALRWMNRLTKEKLADRENDHLDRRRVFVKLSASGQKAMSNYLATLPPHLAPL